MRKVRKSRFNKGFSMAEVLIVVAIIGILLAVAIPNVLAYYRTLKLTELDDSARTIFLAAQNRITALENQGVDLKTLGIDSHITMTDKPTVNFWRIGTDGTDDDTAKLRTLLPGGSIDMQLQNNHYVVEFDPTTGAVYAVWYWENGKFVYDDHAYKTAGVPTPSEKDSRLPYMVGYYGGTSIDRAEVQQMPIPTVNIINAEELRVDISIPAIGVSGAADKQVFVEVYVDGVKIIDKTHLWPATTGATGRVVLDTLKEYINPTASSIVGDVGWTFGDKFKDWKNDKGLTETVPGDDITVTVVVSYDGDIDGQYLIPQSVSARVNSLFESIEETAPDEYTAKIAYGRHLQNLHTGYSTSIGPTSGASEKITSAEQTRDINFAATNKTGDPANDVYYWGSTYATTGDDKYESLHPINNNKLKSYNGNDHEIRNMDAGHYMYAGLFSYVNGGNYTGIKLVNSHIHDGDDSDVAGALGTNIFAGSLIGVSGGSPLTVENCSVYYEYDENKDIDLKDKFDELFSNSFDLETIKLYDSKTGLEYVGGSAAGMDLYAPMLKGLPHIGAPNENSTSGGLIGNTQAEATIKNCYVSVINIGAQHVGGLIGNAGDDVTIENSYSSSFLYGNRTVGGLIGIAGGNVTIYNSYAAGEIMNGYEKGFIGAGLFNRSSSAAASSDVRNSYAAIRYLKADGVPVESDRSDFPTAGTVYGTFSGDDATSNPNFYVAQSGVKYGYNDHTDVNSKVACGNDVTTNELANKIGTDEFGITANGWYAPVTGNTNDGAGTYPYRLIKELKDPNSLSDPYPYPMLKDKNGSPVPHYGDWLENDNASFTNWEQYPDSIGSTDKYGFWGFIGTDDGIERINTLYKGNSTDNKLEYAVADGYGVLVKREGSSGSTAPTVNIDGVGDITFESTTATWTDKGYKIESAYTDEDSNEYDLYVLPAPDYSTAAPTSYYIKVTVDGTEYWYNPDFACEVLDEEPTFAGAPALDTPQDKPDAEGQPAPGSTVVNNTSGVVIRTARQLANLAVYTDDTTMGAKARGWSYTQLLDIDYSEYTGAELLGKEVAAGGVQTHQGSAMLTGTSTEHASYDGKGFQIRNLYLISFNDGIHTYAGLFGNVEYADISHVRLVNVSVGGSGAEYTGGLVGKARNCKIEDCGIYVEDVSATPDGTDDEYKKFIISGPGGSGYVGGLAGYIDVYTDVSKSFAAVKVFSGQYVGGFAGYIRGLGGAITSCYSGGHTENGNYSKDSVNVATSLSSGYAGGFAGHMEGINLYGVNYTTCSVGSSGGNNLGLFVAESGSGVHETLYATGLAFDIDTGDTVRATGGGVFSSAVLTGGAIPKNEDAGFKTHPYDDELFNKVDGNPNYDDPMSYPFKSDLSEHHGDWDELDSEYVAYIEEYKPITGSGDSVYGVYVVKAADFDQVAEINTLKSQSALDTEGLTLVNDCYRVISSKELATPTDLAFTYDDVNSGKLKVDTALSGEVEALGVNYYVYDFLEDYPNAASVTNYYHSIELDGTTFFYNPDFGLEAYDMTLLWSRNEKIVRSKPEAAGKDASGTPAEFMDGSLGDLTTTADYVVIRSARQLANIQKYTENIDTTISSAAQGKTYDQLLDVDFKTYTADILGNDGLDRLNPATISTYTEGVNTYVGAYDGHGMKIQNLYISGSGLFSVVDTGSVKNVRLVDVSVNGSSSDLATGGLVGVLQGGTVSNCGIYVSDAEYYDDFTVTGSGENGVGGLIGEMMNGSVSGSFAAVMVKGTAAADAATHHNPVGGFVGKIIGGTVTDCYAGGFVTTAGSVTTYTSDSVNVSGNNYVGGFVGNVDPAASFSGINYSTASVGGPDETTLGLFAGQCGLPGKTTGVTLYAHAKAFKGSVDTATGGFTANTATPVVPGRDETAYLDSPVKQTGKIDATDTKYNAEGDEYPYQTNLEEHHGDWIGLVMGSYYDIVNGTTGYFANGANITGAAALVPHSASGSFATDDGYEFLSEADLGDVVLGINGVRFELTKEILSTPINGYNYAYKVPAGALNTMPTDSYYFTVSVNGQFFAANFAFAGEIFDYETVTDLSKPAAKSLTGGVAIRSPRQLANAGIWTNRSEASGAIARGLKYEQLLDINFDQYDGELPKIYDGNKAKPTDTTNILYNHVPITLSGSDAGYNGNGYTIRGLLPGYLLDVVDGSNTFALNGLFGRVKGASISGVNLINPRVVGYADNKAVAQLDETVAGPISLPAGGEPKPIASGDNVMVEGETYTLLSSSLSEGEIKSPLSCGENDMFTIYPKTDTKNAKVDKSSTAISWNYTDNNFSVDSNSRRLALTGSMKKDNLAVKFTTNDAAKVKVWWVSRETDSIIKIINDSETEIARREGTIEARKEYFDEFEVDSKGTYYIGADKSGLFIYKIEVTVISSVGPGGGGGGVGGGGTSGDDYVDADMLDKGILAPIAGLGFEIGSSARVRVGAVAGILDGAKVENSGAYVDRENVDHPSADDAYDYYIVKNEITGNEDAAGGFAGDITGGTVTGSFSAVKVIGVRTAGGFAGKLEGTAVVTNCYVGGHTVKGTYLKLEETSGGADPKLEKSEYQVNVSTTEKSKLAYTGGFVGEVVGGDVKFTGVCYTTASVGMAYNTVGGGGEQNTDISTIGQFAGKGTPDSSSAQLYASGSIFRKVAEADDTETDDSKGYESFPMGSKAGFKSKTYEVDKKNTTYDFFPVRTDEEEFLDQVQLVRDVVADEKVKESAVYDTSLIEGYPYPKAGDVHHGDWTVRFDLIYYEVYSKDYVGSDVKKILDATDIGANIGFYATLRETDASGDYRVVNTLQSDKMVYDSGYMILTNSDTETVVFGISSVYGGKQDSGAQTYLTKDDRIDNNGKIVDQKGAVIAKRFFVIPFDAIQIAPSDTYYQHVTINGQPYMLNQHFACEAVNVGLTKKDASGKEVMDYETVRAKPGVVYKWSTLNDDGTVKPETDKTTDDSPVVIIRSPWNMASVARYTRNSNESGTRDMARTLTYLLMLDIDYKAYNDANPFKIYDGNTDNRSQSKHYLYLAGTDFPYGQAPSMLADGGVFEGNGHKISNLYLSSDSTKPAYVGLFGEIRGEGSAVRDIVMDNPHVNAWIGPDDGIYVGTVAGQILEGATLENVTLNNLEMDFHSIPKWSSSKFNKNEDTNAKFNAVGGAVGQLVNGTVKNIHVNGVSIDFNSDKYVYTTAEKEVKGVTEKYLELAAKGASGSVGVVSSVKKSSEINIGGAIGEIDASKASVTLDGGDKVYVNNVYVVNPSINANNEIDSGKGDIVGGVIGKADGGAYDRTTFTTASRNITIENAGAYVDHEKADTSIYLSITDDDKAYDEFTVTSTDKGSEALTGGFVGRSDPFVKLVDCFAAVKVSGGDYVGGFAGDIEGSYVKDCYSGGHTIDGEYEKTVDANVTGSGRVGGFAGRMQSRDSVLALEGILYSTCSVSNTGSSVNIGVFQGTNDNVKSMKDVVAKAAPGSVTLYATGTVKDGGTALDESSYLCTSTAILWPVGTDLTGFKTSRYDQTLTGNFPYRTNLKEHHGDWVDMPVASSLCYYEAKDENGDGTAEGYGVWGYIDPTAATPKNTLQIGVADDSVECALVDGYGVLVKKGGLVPEYVTVGGEKFEIDTTAIARDDDIGIDNYILYSIKIDCEKVPTENYYNEITVNGTKYWFNPFFACEVQKPVTNITGVEPMAKPGAAGKGSTDPTDKYADKVVIRTGRQLENMAKQTGSTCESVTVGSAKEAAQNRSYVQLLDINYDYERSKQITPAALNNGSYDGNSFVIRNLSIGGTTAADNGVGLFGTTGGALSNIRLVNVMVDGGLSDNVGALAGHYIGSEAIEGCGVYVDDVTETSSGSDLTSAEVYVERTVKGTNNVGGLIGLMDSGSLKECFAAVKVAGKENVGGLVGHISNNVTLTDCYSGGHTEGGDYDGQKDNVSGVTNVGGLVGVVDSGKTVTLIGTNYSTCSVQVTDSSRKAGLLIGSGDAGKASAADLIAYATGKAFDSSSDKEIESTKLNKEAYLSPLNDMLKEPSGCVFHPYDEHWITNATEYPYPSETTHYGDWAMPSAPSVQAAGIAYVEEYYGGSIGLQIVGYVDEGSGANQINGGSVIDTLDYDKDAPLTTISTYYVTFTNDNGTGSVTVGELDSLGSGDSLYSTSPITRAIQSAILDAYTDLELGELTVMAYETTEYDAPSSLTSSELSQAVYVSIGDELNDTPGYAGVSYSDAADFGTTGNPFIVRTARQLDNILDTETNENMYFRQTHDINCDGLTDYSGAEEFAGNFDGRGYQIKNLMSDTPENCTGLFSSLSGKAKISNVVLYTPSSGWGMYLEIDDSTDDEYLKFGVIARESNGDDVELTNCVVAGYYPEFYLNIKNSPKNWYYGGLIGLVKSGKTTIRNCAAINDVDLLYEDSGVTGNEFYCGGPVGGVTGGELNLENCYAGGYGPLANNIGGSGRKLITASVYGLVGNAGGNVTYTNCYSWMVDREGTGVGLISGSSAAAESNYYLSKEKDHTLMDQKGTYKRYSDFMADDRSTTLFKGAGDDAFGEATDSYPIKCSQDEDFPFPEVIREVDKDGNPGDFVHYGDWPTDATKNEFGLFLVYGANDTTMTGGDAVAVMFDKSGDSTYKQERKGTSTDSTWKGFWGFAIRKVNSGKQEKIEDLKNNLKVEIYENYEEGKSNSPKYTFDFTSLNEIKDVDLRNVDEFNGYDLFIPNSQLTGVELIGGSSRIIVKYKDIVVASFNWNAKVDPTKTAFKTGDPGMPEGPSFEAAILPDKFILPEIEEDESRGGDGHTEHVRLRSYVAKVHLSRG